MADCDAETPRVATIQPGKSFILGEGRYLDILAVRGNKVLWRSRGFADVVAIARTSETLDNETRGL